MYQKNITMTTKLSVNIRNLPAAGYEKRLHSFPRWGNNNLLATGTVVRDNGKTKCRIYSKSIILTRIIVKPAGDPSQIL